MIATHDDDTVSELIGINMVYLKVGSFGLGAFIAGIAGGCMRITTSTWNRNSSTFGSPSTWSSL